jgi:hypothetical protein
MQCIMQAILELLGDIKQHSLGRHKHSVWRGRAAQLHVQARIHLHSKPFWVSVCRCRHPKQLRRRLAREERSLPSCGTMKSYSGAQGKRSARRFLTESREEWQAHPSLWICLIEITHRFQVALLLAQLCNHVDRPHRLSFQISTSNR